MNHIIRYFLVATLFCFAGTSAHAYVIDFEGYTHGQIINNQYYAGYGVTISAVNDGGGPDLAVVFDSELRGTRDDDLEGPNGLDSGVWDYGNIAEDEILGNLLIIQENRVNENNDDIMDLPDDEGSRPAGTIYFDFENPVLSFGFDLIDVEGRVEYNRDRGYFATFYSGSESTRVGFGDLPILDPTVEYGNNSANRIAPFTAEALGIGAFDRVAIDFGGSAAIDNVVIATPEPSTFILLGLGLLGFYGINRRRFTR